MARQLDLAFQRLNTSLLANDGLQANSLGAV